MLHKLITCLGLYDLLIPAHTDKTRLVSQWQVPSRRPHRYSQLQDGYYQDGYYQDGYYQDGYYQDGYHQNGYYQDGYHKDGYY